MGVIALLLIVKVALYAPWCRLGLHRLAVAPPARPWPLAFSLAAARVALGFGAGFGFGALLLWLTPAQNRLGFHPAAWLGGMALLRWLLWSALAAFLRRDARALLVPAGARDFLWRLGGWTLSLLGDGAALALGVALGGIPC